MVTYSATLAEINLVWNSVVHCHPVPLPASMNTQNQVAFFAAKLPPSTPFQYLTAVGTRKFFINLHMKLSLCKLSFLLTNLFIMFSPSSASQPARKFPLKPNFAHKIRKLIINIFQINFSYQHALGPFSEAYENVS